MKLHSGAVVADAVALFRRDRALLLAIAGPFWFLPSFALTLLVPQIPAPPEALEAGSAEATAWAQAFADWIGANGGWFLLGAGLGALGTATLYALYLDRARPDVAGALRIALGLWPRYMLLGALVTMLTLGGAMLWLLPGLYLLGRMLPASPALVAERPIGAGRAVARGFALSRGAGLPLMAVTTATLALDWLLPQPLVALQAWLDARAGGPNPVAVATVAALAAGLAALAALAWALLAVAAYRRLAER